jgi:sugar lactone lactonase YvrE
MRLGPCVYGGMAALLSGFTSAVFLAVGCGNGDDVGPKPAGDASMDGTTGDAGGGTDAKSDAPSEGGGEASGPAVTFLVHFDRTKNEQPEGLWELDSGVPVVGLAPLATLVTVADAGAHGFGTIGEAGTAAASFTLGIATDPAKNVYVGVGAAGAGPVPAPGVYKFSPAGEAGTLFASAAAMNFPNGLDFVGSILYVADSGGTIYTIDTTATAPVTPQVWSADALLAPDMAACDGGVPLAIGANGIVHDANNFYVTNTNHGRVIKIPREADGGAGAATTIVDDCAFLGADGLFLDTKDSTLIVALNIQNKIARVALDGGTSLLVSGPPLDAPASLIIDTVGGQRRLLFTNASFFSPADAGLPGLLTLPIP